MLVTLASPCNPCRYGWAVFLWIALLVIVSCERTAPKHGPAQPPIQPLSDVQPSILSPLHADPKEAIQVLEGLRLLAKKGDVSAMAPFLYGRTRGRIQSLSSDELQALFAGDVVEFFSNGGRVVLHLMGKIPQLAVMFLTPSGFKYDLNASLQYLPESPLSESEEQREILLEEALAGLGAEGKLMARIATSEGELQCELFEGSAPRNVASFVGLARGLRAFRDSESGDWVRRPYYDGLSFHRTRPRVMVQGGCPVGDGTGDPGFVVVDELDMRVRHDQPGRLCMANRGPNQGNSQIILMDAAAPWLDDQQTIIGQCEPISLIAKMVRISATRGVPDTPLVIRSVRAERR